MKKNIIIFTLLTLLFIFLGFIVKSRYYHFPYPNLIEYFLSFVLLIVMVISLSRRNKINLKIKLLTGFLSIVILMGSLNLLNLAFQWHPLNLNLPFTKSQSFEVGVEPYQWKTAYPETYGYSKQILTGYFNNIREWNRLRAILVVKDDKLIIEKYFSGATRYSAFNVHSVTKSITSALVGLAVQYNYVNSENDLVLSFFPEYESRSFGKFKRALTVKNLLSMRGGWAGGDGHQTAEQCILKENLYMMPDTEFKYFTGSQNILSAILTKKTKQSTKEFADQYLFKPLGIKNGFWRKVDGYYAGGDESYFTARDLARFGKMYLNKGNIDGLQVLDSSWVEKTFMNYTDTSNQFRSTDAYDEIGYGLCWWIFKINNNQVIYSARGKGGQHIIVMPDKNIVLVILQEWNPLKRNVELENKLLGDLLQIL